MKSDRLNDLRTGRWEAASYVEFVEPKYLEVWGYSRAHISVHTNWEKVRMDKRKLQRATVNWKDVKVVASFKGTELFY